MILPANPGEAKKKFSTFLISNICLDLLLARLIYPRRSVDEIYWHFLFFLKVQKKRRIVARVQCRNIKNECPKPTCEEPILLPGRCCKTCPGDSHSKSPSDATLKPRPENRKIFQINFLPRHTGENSFSYTISWSKTRKNLEIFPPTTRKFAYSWIIQVDFECNVYICTLFKRCVACVFIFSATIIYLIKLRQRGDRQLLIYVKWLKTTKLE